MKKLLIIFLAMLIVSPAYADRDRGGHYWRDGGHHDGGLWLFPALVGGAIFYDVTRPQPPVVYVQPPPAYAPNVAPVVQQYWYFCPAANAYYPYVASCPGGWQAVPATPPAVPVAPVQ
jgi:hypothetical protein